MGIRPLYDDGYLILKDGGRLEEEADCLDPKDERDSSTEVEQEEQKVAQEEEEEEDEEEELPTPAVGPIQADSSISKKRLGLFVPVMCLLCFLLVCAAFALVMLLEKERMEVLQLKEERDELMHEVLKCSEGFGRQRDESNRWNSIVEYLNSKHLNLEETGIKLITRFSKPFPLWRRWRDLYTGDEE